MYKNKSRRGLIMFNLAEQNEHQGLATVVSCFFCIISAKWTETGDRVLLGEDKSKQMWRQTQDGALWRLADADVMGKLVPSTSYRSKSTHF